MSADSLRAEPPALSPASGERDYLFLGSVTALAVSLLERPMVEAMMQQRLAGAPGAALSTATTVLWASSILAPLFFLLAVFLAGAALWALGQFLDEGSGFRSVLNVCAIAQVAKIVAGLVLLGMLKLELLTPGAGGISDLLGTGYRAGDGLLASIFRAFASPPAWVWVIALAAAIRVRLRWKPATVIVASLFLFALEVLVTAIRVQQSFIPS